MADTTAKLKKVEDSIKRWTTRLTRATNMIAKLHKQRRRLQAQMGPVSLTDLIGEPEPKPQPAAPAVSVETDHISELDLPAFLDRRNPEGIRKAAEAMQAKADTQLVDKLKAQRADQVEADKHKMPLTGRSAIDYVKVTPKAKRKAKAAAAS